MNAIYIAILVAYHRWHIRLYREHRRYLEREIRGTDWAIADHDSKLRDLGVMA